MIYQEKLINATRQVIGKAHVFLMLLLVLVVGCTPTKPKYLGAPIEGYNHTSAAINRFTVNGDGGPNIGPHQGGGGQNCCVTLPVKWGPGLQVVVEWEKDPNSGASRYWAERFPSKEWTIRAKEHATHYTRHRAVVEVAPYEDLGIVNVHFLPCNQVKVAAGTTYPGLPEHPYKYSLNLKEPETCPQPGA